MKKLQGRDNSKMRKVLIFTFHPILLVVRGRMLVRKGQGVRGGERCSAHEILFRNIDEHRRKHSN